MIFFYIATIREFWRAASPVSHLGEKARKIRRGGGAQEASASQLPGGAGRNRDLQGCQRGRRQSGLFGKRDIERGAFVMRVVMAEGLVEKSPPLEAAHLGARIWMIRPFCSGVTSVTTDMVRLRVVSAS